MVKYKYFGDKNRKLALSPHLAQCGKRSPCLCVGFVRIGKDWEILGEYGKIWEGMGADTLIHSHTLSYFPITPSIKCVSTTTDKLCIQLSPERFRKGHSHL